MVKFRKSCSLSLIFLSLAPFLVHSKPKKSLPEQYQPITQGKNQFQCPLCKRQYAHKGNVIAHIKIYHSNIKPFKCSDCNKTFHFPSRLKKHVAHTHNKVHKGERSECNVCNRPFSKRANLNRHILKMHSNVVTLVTCKACKSIILPSSHQQHKKRLCRARFTKKKLPLNHAAIDHLPTSKPSEIFQDSDKDVHNKGSGEKKLQCHVCMKFFTNRFNLNRHIANIHVSTKVTCDHCGKTMLPSSLINHKKRLCKERFKTKKPKPNSSVRSTRTIDPLPSAEPQKTVEDSHRWFDDDCQLGLGLHPDLVVDLVLPNTQGK